MPEGIIVEKSILKKLFKALAVDKKEIEDIINEIKDSESQEKLNELLKYFEKVNGIKSNNKSGKNKSSKKSQINLDPIGKIHTPYKRGRDAPFQAYKSKDIGKIEVSKNYEEGLDDLEGFSHLILLYEFHKPVKKSVKENCSLESYGLRVKPYLDKKTHGVFATRSPDRPNPIGISVVKLLERKENILKVKGVDILDGTPLLDIKPYVPKFDRNDETRIGWIEGHL